MGIKQRKNREREEKRDLILEAAKRISIEEGFEKVSIRKIAEEIEYSSGTIYLYFKNRDEILFELHNIAFQKFYEQQLTISHIKEPLEKLREHGRVYIRFGLENPDLYELMFIVQAPGNEIETSHSWKEGMKTFDFLKQNLQECLDAGYFKGSDVNTLSIAMWSLVHGIVSLYLRKRMAMVPKEFMKPVLFGAYETMLDNLNQKK
jgi:AcrR family transcriptional regulator